MRVFLGGTCNGSTWRDELIPLFDPRVEYFNPVVEDWTPACQREEQREKEHECDVHLYVITSEMKGVYSIAEVMDSVHQSNKHTILQVVPAGFDEAQLKSLRAVVELVCDRFEDGYIGDHIQQYVAR